MSQRDDPSQSTILLKILIREYSGDLDETYRQLSVLLERKAASSTADLDHQIAAKFKRLRSLQHLQARRMSEYFRKTHLPQDLADDQLARAEALLREQ